MDELGRDFVVGCFDQEHVAIRRAVSDDGGDDPLQRREDGRAGERDALAGVVAQVEAVMGVIFVGAIVQRARHDEGLGDDFGDSVEGLDGKGGANASDPWFSHQ